MRLTDQQIAEFEDQGFLVLPDLFSAAEVAVMRRAMADVFAEESDANVKEAGGGVVRTAMGLHLRHDVFARLVRHPRFVEPARQLRGNDLYVQQVKINVKAGFDGDQWQWHYDFATHQGDDGVPEPLPLNLHVFLDDVTHYNGPLYFLPGSHAEGPAPAWHDTTSTSYPLWTLDNDLIAQLIERGGIVAPKGKPGTGFFFHGCLVHGSPPNMSPWDRLIVYISYNNVDNHIRKFQRADWIAHRDFTPLEALDDDCLLTVSREAAE